MLMRILFTITLLVLYPAIIGCQAQEREERERIIHTPLEIDPMHPPDLVGWWANDEQLLEMRDGRRYRLFRSLDRHRRPLEEGRWTRPSYAYIWLETYGATRQGMMRANLRMVDGQLSLILPNHEPFLKLDAPPATPEEPYFGLWESPNATLELRESLRYIWTVTHERDLPHDFLAGHRGSWEVHRGGIVLRPSPAGLDPVRLSIEEREGGQPALVLDDTRFTREGENGD